MQLTSRFVSCLFLVSAISSCGGKDDAGPAAAREQAVTVFFGTYTRGWACPATPAEGTAACASKGIYRAQFDGKTGALTQPQLAAEADNPSYLTISADGKFLYAVNEVDDFKGDKSGAVSAFAIEDSGALRLINQLSSHGADPCHVSLNGAGNTVLVANYSGGNVSSYRVGANGGLSEGSTVSNPGEHGPHMNQEAAHAHFIAEGATPGLVYVADLGLDKVFLYDLNASTSVLTPHAAQPTVTLAPPGAGPRHIAFHPNKKFLYTNNELATSASAFSRNPDTGRVTEPALQTISTIPLPFASTSNNGEIQIDRKGQFAYVSNRGHDSLSTFSIDQSSGKLAMLDNVPSGGKVPRDFKLDPSGRFLLVAHQNTDDLLVFAIDQGTGKLTRTDHMVKLSRPVNVAFWEGKKK